MTSTRQDRTGAITHRFIETNGIRMHIAEQGEGPLVILCHGFPECWYSWRKQLPALAAAGYRAVAPDQRGYGQTDRPDGVEAYDILRLVADIVGLVHALGEEQATIIGHDWGAPVAWHCALLRPDIFHSLGLLSVPYLRPSWNDVRPTDAMRQFAGDEQFYQLYFQEPGRAEAALEADVRRTMRTVLYAASGDAPAEQRWRLLFDASERLADTAAPEVLPDWLSEDDVEVFAREFARTGFRGALNWYRNIDRMWELTRFLSGAQVRQPAVFIAGELDAVLLLYAEVLQSLESSMPRLRDKVLLPGAGHWVQQERPAEVNLHLLQFLAEL